MAIFLLVNLRGAMFQCGNTVRSRMYFRRPEKLIQNKTAKLLTLIKSSLVF